MPSEKANHLPSVISRSSPGTYKYGETAHPSEIHLLIARSNEGFIPLVFSSGIPISSGWWRATDEKFYL